MQTTPADRHDVELLDKLRGWSNPADPRGVREYGGAALPGQLGDSDRRSFERDATRARQLRGCRERHGTLVGKRAHDAFRGQQLESETVRFSFLVGNIRAEVE